MTEVQYVHDRADDHTMPAAMAAIMKAAVEGGDYAVTSEVIREALRDWKAKRAVQWHELEALKAAVDKGLADVAAGRVIERGRRLLAKRSHSVRLTRPSEKVRLKTASLYKICYQD